MGESGGYNEAKGVVPICAMKGGSEMQRYLDVLVPSPPCTLKIVNGEGPIHFVGSHCVDYYGFKDVDVTEDEDDTEADEEMDSDEGQSPKNESDKKSTPGKDDVKKTTPLKEGSGKK